MRNGPSALAVLISSLLIPPAVLAADTRPELVEFTILHLNDVYEIERPAGQSHGGLSRVARIRQELVAENPRTFTVLSGDLLSPSPLGTAKIDGQALAGRQMIAVLNVMGLDFATFGNHEFDLKKDQLRQRLEESAFSWVSSNVTDAGGLLFPGVSDDVVLRVVNKAGRQVRVGLIGLTIDSTKPEYVRFRDPIAAARERVRKLRDSCDVIVALTHLAIEQDQRLAAAVPEIHLILGGHDHDNHHECNATVNRYSAPIFKADSNAKTATVHRLAFDVETRRLTIHSQLKPVTDDPDGKAQQGKAPEPLDTRTERIVRWWAERGYAAINDSFHSAPSTEVARSEYELDGLDSSIRKGPTNLTQLIALAMREKVPNAQAAIFNCGSIRIDDILKAGTIRVYDVLRILPYPEKVIGVKLGGQLLIDLLTQGERIPGKGGFLQMTGIAGGKGKPWTIGGQPIESGKSYLVAMNDFLLKGSEQIYGDVSDKATINGRLREAWGKLDENEKKLELNDAQEFRRAVIAYMGRDHGQIRIAPLETSPKAKPALPTKTGPLSVVEVDVAPLENRTVRVSQSDGAPAVGSPPTPGQATDTTLGTSGSKSMNITPIVVIGSVFAALKAGVDCIKIANDTRNVILGITDKRSTLSRRKKGILYNNDWLPMQVGISLTFFLFMTLYVLVPVSYDSSAGGWLSGIGSAVLMAIAFVGNVYGAYKDRIELLHEIRATAD